MLATLLGAWLFTGAGSNALLLAIPLLLRQPNARKRRNI